jgi:hypothetical protein
VVEIAIGGVDQLEGTEADVVQGLGREGGREGGREEGREGERGNGQQEDEGAREGGRGGGREGGTSLSMVKHWSAFSTNWCTDNMT